jgi:predicted metal-dependent phosphoesterase TrpH
MKLDLHLHSHVSDGQLPPAEVVRAALAAGLDVISLTDHDAVSGVPEATEAARGTALRVIPGIEVSTRYGAHELHILGYWVDPHSEPMRAHERRSILRREERIHAMIDRLARLGVAVDFAAVREAAGPSARTLGRPHLARAMMAAGHVRTFGQAFERYLADGGSAYVAQDFPTPAEAIETIHAAGGVAVWAHPDVTIFDQEIRTLAAQGLDGVEVYRPTVAPADSLLFETGARELGLFPTGGSDWHGPTRFQLGDFYVRAEDVTELLAAGEPGP